MNDEQNYVTRDLWTESLKRMEAMMAANLAQHKSLADGLRADIAEMSKDVISQISSVREDVNSQISDIRGDIKAINVRIDGLEALCYRELPLFAIVVTAVVFVVQYIK